jgi:hypothetical protein
MKLLFIFSLPRSGSTLVQRELNRSDIVKTSPETWFLLNTFIANMNNRFQTYSIHSDSHAKLAMNEFVKNDVGHTEYKSSLKIFFLSVYELASKNKQVFIEKTPRNSIYINEIVDVFGEDAQYLILVRNPAAIALSMINTWGGGKLNLFSFAQDFEIGLVNIINKIDEGMSVLKYEDVLLNPSCIYSKINNIIPEPEKNVPLETIDGLMGDPTGQYFYKTINKERVDDWKCHINTLSKKYALKKLICKIGEKNFSKLGYSYSETLQDCSKITNYSLKYELLDISMLFYGVLYRRLQPFFLKGILTKGPGYAKR